MLAEKYLKQRFAEGRAEERARWIDWNRRREEAQAKGEEFTEPPPPENPKKNG